MRPFAPALACLLALVPPAQAADPDPDLSDLDDLPEASTSDARAPQTERDDPFASPDPSDLPDIPDALPQVHRPLGIPIGDRTPFGGGYTLGLVATEPDAVVAEIPVLIATQPGDLRGPVEVVATWRDGDRVVLEQVHALTPASVARKGPTFLFLKALVPVGAPRGTVSVTVATRAPGARATTERFVAQADYAP